MRLNPPWGTARELGLSGRTAGIRGHRRRTGTRKLAANAAKVVSVGALLVIPAMAAVSAIAPAAGASVAHPATAKAKHASKVTASAAPATAVAGTKVTLSAKVTSSGATPTGTVSFYAGSTKLCAAKLSHAATHCTADFPAAGTYTVTAKYSGDGSHASASGTTKVKATKAATTTTGSASAASPPYPGETVTLSATVSSHSPLVPTGTVRFSDTAGTLCTGTLSGGKTHCTYAWPTAGGYTVTVTYSGDRAHTGSAAAGTVTVTKLATTTAITDIDPGSVMPGSSATVTVTVTTPAGTPEPTGTVQVAPTNVAAPVAAGYKCAITLKAAMDGTGSCTVTPPNPSFGVIDYEATYEGDTAHGTSVSTGIHELIVPDTTTTTVAFDPTSGTVGDADTITATVTNEVGSNISPSAGGSGTVTFSIGGTDIAGCTDVPLSYTAETGNTATCSYTPGTAGTVTVTATYSGDPENQGSSGTGNLTSS